MVSPQECYFWTGGLAYNNIAKIYWNEIWKIYGIPQNILSDRGSQFALKFIKDLTKALETKMTLSMMYHP